MTAAEQVRVEHEKYGIRYSSSHYPEVTGSQSQNQSGRNPIRVSCAGHGHLGGCDFGKGLKWATWAQARRAADAHAIDTHITGELPCGHTKCAACRALKRRIDRSENKHG